MKMKALIISTLLIGSSYAHANFVTDCKFAFRASTDNLVKAILDFKEQKMTATALGFAASSIEFQVSSLRSACYFAEPAENRICVERYQKIYNTIKAKVNAGDLMTGKQTDVEYSGFENAMIKTKIKFTDIQCEY